ncbi:MAG: HAD family hydrolase [Thermomicrobiales bacterium]
MKPLDPRPELVLFDLDDTLCDYASARWLRLRVAFDRALGLLPERPAADLDRMAAESIAMHPHGTDHFAELLSRHGAPGASSVEEARHWYRTNRFYGLSLFNDALETLDVLRTTAPGRRVGMITNGSGETQQAKIDLLGIRSLFDFIIVSGEFGFAKPDRRIFDEALRLGAASAESAIFIGDSAEFDMTGAHNAGIRSIWINRTGLPWLESSFAPDHVVADLRSVAALLT